MATRSRLGISEEETFKLAASILGGTKMFGGAAPKTRMQVHTALTRGLPTRAVSHMMNALSHLEAQKIVVVALGMSPRSWQRHKNDTTRLDIKHSSQAWKFAEILAKATEVFGSQEEAERWLGRPAMGLDRQRPIDLLETQTGTELVEEFLDRIDLGAYS